MQDFIRVAIEAAKLGGDVIRQCYGKTKIIEYKGEIDIVTEVDKHSERLIVDLIHDRFPQHSVLAEEGGSTFRSSEYTWVIDPLDGTSNFAHDYPFFCVSVALEQLGEVIAGAVYHPIFEEMFVAEKGSGAFLNEKRIRVSSVSRLRQALLSTGFPYDVLKNPDEALSYFSNFIQVSQAVRRDGSAALDLCYLAMGRFDGFWELRLKPWDTAAGTLIVREAGGRVSNFQNESHSIYHDQIIASNGLLHEEMIAVVNRNVQRS